MTIVEYAKLLEYIQQNNYWGINMYKCISRQRKCVKYVGSTFDSRDGKVCSVRFNLGFGDWTDFRVESDENLQKVYAWLNERWR